MIKKLPGKLCKHIFLLLLHILPLQAKILYALLMYGLAWYMDAPLDDFENKYFFHDKNAWNVMKIKTYVY